MELTSLNEGRSISSGDTRGGSSMKPLGPCSDALNEGRSISSGDTGRSGSPRATRWRIARAQRRPEHKLRRHDLPCSPPRWLHAASVQPRSTKAGA